MGARNTNEEEESVRLYRSTVKNMRIRGASNGGGKSNLGLDRRRQGSK